MDDLGSVGEAPPDESDDRQEDGCGGFGIDLTHAGSSFIGFPGWCGVGLHHRELLGLQDLCWGAPGTKPGWDGGQNGDSKQGRQEDREELPCARHADGSS